MPIYSLISIGAVVAVFVIATVLSRRRSGAINDVALGGPHGSRVIATAKKGNLNPYVELMRATDLDTPSVRGRGSRQVRQNGYDHRWLANAPNDAAEILAIGNAYTHGAWMYFGDTP